MTTGPRDCSHAESRAQVGVAPGPRVPPGRAAHGTGPPCVAPSRIVEPLTVLEFIRDEEGVWTLPARLIADLALRHPDVRFESPPDRAAAERLLPGADVVYGVLVDADELPPRPPPALDPRQRRGRGLPALPGAGRERRRAHQRTRAARRLDGRARARPDAGLRAQAAPRARPAARAPLGAGRPVDGAAALRPARRRHARARRPGRGGRRRWRSARRRWGCA